MGLSCTDKLEIRVALGTEIKLTLNDLRENRDFYGRKVTQHEINRIRRLNHVRLHVLNA
jgi:hypothetical protein